jgi:hypothetical protein
MKINSPLWRNDNRSAILFEKEEKKEKKITSFP